MKKIPKVTWVLLIAFIPLMLTGLMLPTQARPSQASVPPTLVEGNPTCAQLVPGTTELKVDPPGAGTFTDGTLTVTITNYTGTSFDFTSNLPVDAVFVKAGDEGNLYRYIPGTFGDTNLTSPGQVHAISHIL